MITYFTQYRYSELYDAIYIIIYCYSNQHDDDVFHLDVLLHCYGMSDL